MPDWTVARYLSGSHAKWMILPEDDPDRGEWHHPDRRAFQDVVKWNNMMYAVVHREQRGLLYVPVPLPTDTVIGRTSTDPEVFSR